MIDQIHRVLLIICVLLFAQLGYGQYAETIVSGRPGNANGPFGVGKGVYQVQMGQNFGRTNNSLSRSYKGFYPTESMRNGPDVLFRIGLKEDFELRVGGSYVFSDESHYENNSSTSASGAERISIGFRQFLFRQKGVLPSTALQFATDFGGSQEYKKDLPDAVLRLNLANRITEKLNLNWNFISRWVPDNPQIVGFYIFSFGYPLAEKLSITAELFGAIDQTTKLNTGMGLAYLINKHFLIDIYGSYGRNEIERGNVEQEVIAFNGGISYRIVRREQ